MAFLLLGHELERLVAMTDFDQDQAGAFSANFGKWVWEKFVKAGAKADTVRMATRSLSITQDLWNNCKIKPGIPC